MVPSPRRLLKGAFTPRYLLLTDTLSTCTLFGTADVIQQLINGDPHTSQSINWSRVGRVAAMGCIGGPMSHLWYRLLESRLSGPVTARLVAKKVLCDLMVAPAFSVTFIAGISILEGKSVSASLSEYRSKFLRIFALDLCVWPITQTLNFSLLPPQYRVIYVNCTQLVYTCALSYIKHND